MFTLTENFYLNNNRHFEADWERSERIAYCEQSRPVSFFKKLVEFFS